MTQMPVITHHHMYAPAGTSQEITTKIKSLKTTCYDRYLLFGYHKITLNKTVYLIVPSRSLRSLSQVAQCHAGNSLRK